MHTKMTNNNNNNNNNNEKRDYETGVFLLI